MLFLFFYSPGTTARSSSIRLALGVICWHITVIYERDVSDIPNDYLGLVTCFQERLHVSLGYTFKLKRGCEMSGREDVRW